MPGVSNSQPSERALVLAAAKCVDQRYMAIIEDFASELERDHTFAALERFDAQAVAAAIVVGLTGSGHPAKILRDHSAMITLNQHRYNNPRRVHRALAAAAKLYEKRVYGFHRPPHQRADVTARPVTIAGHPRRVT